MLNIKQIAISFILCSVVVLANNTSNLKECQNEQDKMQGCIEKAYYVNGNLLRETPYKNGEKEGIEKWYHEDGNLLKETPYKNGERDGIEKYYHENGNLWIEVPAINNKANGEARYYLDNKKPLATITFKDDEAIKGKCANDKNLDNNILDSIKDDKSWKKITKVLKEYCKQ